MDEARCQLEKLAEVNRLGVDEEWEFNEWCHGRTGQPMGYPHQAWSAGMYVFAYHCVSEGRVPILLSGGWDEPKSDRRAIQSNSKSAAGRPGDSD